MPHAQLRTRLAAGLALSLALAACATPRAAEPDAASPATPGLTLPVHTGGGHLVHEVWLNGQGPFWAVLDTGNQGTMVFERVVEQLDLRTAPLGELGGAGPGTIDVDLAQDVTVGLGSGGGELTWLEPQVTVLPDAAALPDFDGRRIDVFLGASLIGEHLVTVDYPAGLLSFGERAGYVPPTNALVLDLELTSGFPHLAGEVAATIAGEPGPTVAGRLLLDLGSPMGLQLDHEPTRDAGLLSEAAVADPERQVVGTMMGIDGVPMDLVMVPAASVVLDGTDLTGMPGLARLFPSPTPTGGPPIPDLIGSLGSAPFVAGRLTLDYAGGRLVYEAP